MTDPQVAIFMLSAFIFLVLLGFPIAFTLVSMSVGFGYYAYFQADNLLNNQIFYLLNQNTYSVMESDAVVEADAEVTEAVEEEFELEEEKVKDEIDIQIDLLQDSDWVVRREAVVTLGEMADERCVEPLARALRDGG